MADLEDDSPNKCAELEKKMSASYVTWLCDPEPGASDSRREGRGRSDKVIGSFPPPWLEKVLGTGDKRGEG